MEPQETPSVIPSRRLVPVASGKMSRTSPRLVIAVAAVVVAVMSAGPSRAVQNATIENLALATGQAGRNPHQIIEYDVFGDSIAAGFGVPAHQTWVGAVSFNLFATQPPDVEHRFYNHAIEGQSISTPSFLAVDQRSPTLLIHLQNFLANPARSTPLAERIVVITPSVNELVVSDQGPSASARVEKAVFGMRTAIWLIRSAGVPARQIVVLPMPPIGLQFAAEYAASSDADRTLASMIVDVNAGLADVLDVRGYPTLDANNNGLAVVEFYDDLFDPATRRRADGLHLDADGHEALGADIDNYFRDR